MIAKNTTLVFAMIEIMMMMMTIVIIAHCVRLIDNSVNRCLFYVKDNAKTISWMLNEHVFCIIPVQLIDITSWQLMLANNVKLLFVVIKIASDLCALFCLCVCVCVCVRVRLCFAWVYLPVWTCVCV